MHVQHWMCATIIQCQYHHLWYEECSYFTYWTWTYQYVQPIIIYKPASKKKYSIHIICTEPTRISSPTGYSSHYYKDFLLAKWIWMDIGALHVHIRRQPQNQHYASLDLQVSRFREFAHFLFSFLNFYTTTPIAHAILPSSLHVLLLCTGVFGYGRQKRERMDCWEDFTAGKGQFHSPSSFPAVSWNVLHVCVITLLSYTLSPQCMVLTPVPDMLHMYFTNF